MTKEYVQSDFGPIDLATAWGLGLSTKQDTPPVWGVTNPLYDDMSESVSTQVEQKLDISPTPQIQQTGGDR